METLKNHTLSGGSYLSNRKIGVVPPPPPPHHLPSLDFILQVWTGFPIRLVHIFQAQLELILSKLSY